MLGSENGRARSDRDQASNRRYQLRGASKCSSDSVHQDWRVAEGSDLSAATRASGPDSRRIQVDGTPLEICSICSPASDRTTTCAAPTTAPPGRELTRVDDDDLADGPALDLRDVPHGAHLEASGSKRMVCVCSVFLTPGAKHQAPGTRHQVASWSIW